MDICLIQRYNLMLKNSDPLAYKQLRGIMNAMIDFLNTPLTIGYKRIENRLLLAPMTGLGHIAFRELLAGFGGCGLMFTEMCNAKALPHENRNNSRVFRWRDEELGNLVCQILGSDPEVMARAAERVAQEGFFGVDINLGCSVTAICKQNAGAALLKDPALAVRIVSAVRKAVSIPVFVKFRTGWKDDPDVAVHLAEQFEDAGADALTFHPRVAPDRRARPPKWLYIQKVKESVGIPVFGNGNVFDFQDCTRMIESTGCDGVALGRMAIAAPWIFSMWSRNIVPEPDVYKFCLLKMAGLLSIYYEPVQALKLFKKFALYLCANFRFGHAIYTRLVRAEDMAGIKNNIEQIFQDCPALSTKPNMNMFL